MFPVCSWHLASSDCLPSCLHAAVAATLFRAACSTALGPAPGDYEVCAAYSAVQASAPAFSMPKSMQSSDTAGHRSCSQDMPGPGHYYAAGTDPAAIGRGAPAFTMGGRQGTQLDDAGVAELPGPGQYFR